MTPRDQAHRQSKAREALEIVLFFACLAGIVLFLSLDGIR